MEFSYSPSSSIDKEKEINKKNGFCISDFFNFNEPIEKKINSKKIVKKKKNLIEEENEKKGIEILKKNLQKKDSREIKTTSESKFIN